MRLYIYIYIICVNECKNKFTNHKLTTCIILAYYKQNIRNRSKEASLFNWFCSPQEAGLSKVCVLRAPSRLLGMMNR